MKNLFISKYNTVALPLVCLIFLGGFTSTEVKAVPKWEVQCTSGYLQKLSTTRFTCKKERGTRNTYSKGTCIMTSPKLVKFQMGAYSYSCMAQTPAGIIRNPFICPAGQTKVKNATNSRRTCSKKVKRYRYLSPTLTKLS